MPRSRNPWFRLGQEAFKLGLEGASVMTLRTMKIAAGGAAADSEVRRMISEKIEAARALQVKALTGGLGVSAPSVVGKSLKHYRRKVRANKRRLLRK